MGVTISQPGTKVVVASVGGPQGPQGLPGQAALQRTASSAMSAGQVVRTHTSGQEMQAATSDLRTKPFDAILLGDVGAGASGNFQAAGPIAASIVQLGAGVACAVGVNASGYPVRAIDPACVSAPNWIGYCDTNGNVAFAPKRTLFFDVLDFGAKWDNVADDTDAIEAMLRAMQQGSTDDSGALAELPFGIGRVTRPIVISQGVRIRGKGGGQSRNTEIQVDGTSWPPVKDGNGNIVLLEGEPIYGVFVCVGYFVGQTFSPPVGRADNATLEGFVIQNTARKQGPAKLRGVHLYAPAVTLYDVNVYDMPDIGVYILGDPSGTPATNADRCRLINCQLWNNGTHGVQPVGSDANVILFEHVSCVGNLRCGFSDHSFLGCTYVNCHASSNSQFNYDIDRTLAPGGSVLVGCYAEGDANSRLKGKISVHGGTMASITPDSDAEGDTWASPNHIASGQSDGGYAYAYLRIENGQYWVDGDLMDPGNGYYYVAHGTGFNTPVSLPAPTFPTTPGATVVDNEITWECVALYTLPLRTFMQVGDASTAHAVCSWGQYYSSGAIPGVFKMRFQGSPEVTDRFSVEYGGFKTISYMLSNYLSRPYPGAFSVPIVLWGDPTQAQLQQNIVYSGSGNVSDADVRAEYYGNFVSGSFIVNARRDGTTKGRPAGEPWAWVSKLPGGLPYSRAGSSTTWGANSHYWIGDTIAPGNGLIFEAYSFANTANPTVNLTGATPPAWDTRIDAFTVDGGITWLCRGSDDPAAFMQALPVCAESQGNSTATDVPGLVADFNALLAKLRAANVIAT